MHALGRHLSVALLFLCLSATAQATILNIDITADDDFAIFLSTDDAVTGTLIGADPDRRWFTPNNYTVTLTPGTTYYIHVFARDLYGVARAWLGEFELLGSDFQFLNGSTRLLTDPAYWQVSASGFGSGYTTPVSHGPNGTPPWNTFISTIDAAAQWIWHPNSDVSPAYFSTPILPVTAATPVSAPATLPLLLLGLAWLLRRQHA